MLAERLILKAVTPERYRSDDLDERVDLLAAEGRFDEARALLNGKTPRAQLFAGATLEEDS